MSKRLSSCERSAEKTVESKLSIEAAKDWRKRRLRYRRELGLLIIEPERLLIRQPERLLIKQKQKEFVDKSDC